MSAQKSVNSKPSKPPNRSSTTTNTTATATSSLSSHLAMVELKQRILTSLSKLSDRDTHQIAVEDLEKTIQSLPSEAVPMLLNCLYDASFSDPKPAVKKESLRLIAAAAAAHSDAAAAHLPKILAHVVRRLKDADSALRDACRDAVGALASQYLGAQGTPSMAAVFVRPFFEAMAEQNKGLQAGAAMCVARAVDCSSSAAAASSPGIFNKLCPRISKLLNNPNFLAKAALLPVVSSLAQVGAIAPQSLDNLLQSIHDCIGSSDWATRKAAADALVALASHAKNLIMDNTGHTLAVLEASRFDKIKPVRESMTEALQLWKSIAGKGDGSPEDQKASTNENCQPNDSLEKSELKNLKPAEKKDQSAKSSPNSPSTLDSENKAKSGTAIILKKKAPGLSDKDINPEFFNRLEARVSDDLPVEVVVPRRHQNSSNTNTEEDSEKNNSDSKGRPNRIGDDSQGALGIRHRSLAWEKWSEERATNGKDSRMRQTGDGDDRAQREFSGNRAGQSDGSFGNTKGNWLAIQRQLLQLERQQAHLMNMLQDFMGGSHDSMITLENRVRGLERVVEDMARDLSISSGSIGRRGGNFGMGFEGSNNRALGKFNNGFSDGGGRFGERYSQTDVSASGARGRGSQWRSEMSDAWDFPTYGGASRNNGPSGTRRGPGSTDKGGSGAGPARFGEGPSARSVWQASKDEATLEAIRVAGDDNINNGTAAGRSSSSVARAAPPERIAEAMGEEGGGGRERERDPAWAAWTNAMDALHEGDMDAAYAEVLSSGDDLLLVKLMDRTGPVIDQLTNEVANETLNAVVQFFGDQNLFDICLSWAQQLAEVVMEHGAEILGMPMELKREILLTLHEASLAMDPPEDWEGATPEQIVMQLASSWDINLQQNEK